MLSSGLLVGGGLSVCPGGVFVVGGVVGEAAVEDADEAVAEESGALGGGGRLWLCVGRRRSCSLRWLRGSRRPIGRWRLPVAGCG